MFTYLYRRFIPSFLREKIYKLFLGDILFFSRTFDQHVKCKAIYWFNFLYQKNEVNKAYLFMGKHGLTSYPFESSLKYKKMEIKVYNDKDINLLYVIHNDKRLYFPSTKSSDEIANLYKDLLIEQDECSPHKYVKSNTNLRKKVLLDIGSAEGIFSLDAINEVDLIYLFECDAEWIDALKATFSPWKEKVVIVEKFVSDKSTAETISLDDFFKGKKCNDLFFKMDIEGSEMSALLGAENILRNGKNIALSVCTYHKSDDAVDVSVYLSSLGYEFEFTEGYMYWNKRLSKGVIRACK